ncbi:unnamed protein product, partial [Coregonus sp. 'balchen']
LRESSASRSSSSIGLVRKKWWIQKLADPVVAWSQICLRYHVNFTGVPLTPAAPARRPEKDFVALNREGVKSGLVTAKEHYQYRATHDRRRAAPARRGSHVPVPPRIPRDTTFGISTRTVSQVNVNVSPVLCRLRPSTPICELLEHKYAQHWLEEQQAKERALEERQLNMPKLGRIQETRTTLLRKSRPMPESTPLWKLPRFQQVGPALDTFRDPYARKKAFSAHFSDSVAQTGQLGQAP